jgi:hypothetical protein
MDSLRGAQQSIERFKPKLAISLYHKPDELPLKNILDFKSLSMILFLYDV